MNIVQRPRRLRGNETIRGMVRETRISKSALIYPAFVAEGLTEPREIEAMPGQYRHTTESLLHMGERLLEAGINKMMLFGIPLEKDPLGSQAYCTHGVVQEAMRALKDRLPELYLIGDVCMCEYTSHGHCGILNGREVDNDETLSYLARIALSQVQAGADMVAPSDMMDGRVAAIRTLLDQNQYTQIPIMSYSVKYASSFYGPFREAADSAPAFGDRRSYQMDVHNVREGVKEAPLDLEEGADLIMVKPAMAFGDVIAKVREAVCVPVASYSVSGEYTMVKCAARAGAMDEEKLICEIAASAFRAGSDVYLTYFAQELARFLDEGRLG